MTIIPTPHPPQAPPQPPKPPPPPPSRVGPVEFAMFDSMVSARCPSDLDPLMRKAGGMWEPGGRRWLIMRRRVGPLIRELRRTTDPLFRHAGLDLDGEGT